MTKQDFLARVDETTAGFQKHLAVADLPRGETPVGLFLTIPHSGWLEPHVFWFPWASKRIRLESAAVYLSAAVKESPVLVFARPDSRAFFDRLESFGIVRYVGRIDGIYDGMGWLYQARV